MIHLRGLPRMPATSSTLTTSSSSGKILELFDGPSRHARHLTCLIAEIVGASRFEQSAKGCHKYAQCLSRDDSRRARVEHPSPAGVSHQLLQPRDDEQSRHARPSRPTGRTTVAPRFPHTSPLRSVWIGRHSRRSPLTVRGSAVRSVSMRRCELSARPSSTVRERRVKDGARRISKPQRIVITIGPRIPYLSGRILCALSFR